MFWHRKNNADWMILLQVSEMIKNVFKNNIWEGKRKLENVFDIRDYIPREKTNYDTSGNLGITYRTRAIISRSRFEAALVYKPRILGFKKESRNNGRSET